jgi:peptidoglycan/LPS O-acetylase OafA/YrhL
MNYYIIFEIIILLFLIIIFRQKNNSKNETDPLRFMSFSNTERIRGIAILMVILQHTGGDFGTRIFTPLGGGGVAVFLILSGYGLSESFKKKGLKDFWKKKIVSILIPWAILYSVCFFKITNFNLLHYLGEITLFKTGCWYLQYLFLWYIIFFITHLNQKIYSYRWYIILVSSLLSFFFGGDLQAEQSLSFPIGLLISEYKDSSNNKQYIYLSIILAILSLTLKQIPVIRTSFDNELIFHPIQLILKLSLAIFIILSVQRNKFLMNNKFLSFSGKISFELYLIHLFFTPRILKNIHEANLYAYIILFFICSYIASYLFYILKERYIKQLL